MYLLPGSFLVLGLTFSWLHCGRLARATTFCLLCAGTALGTFSPIALTATATLAGCVLILENKPAYKTLTLLTTLALTVLSLSMFMHLVPGFANILLFDQLSLSHLSRPFSMYLNFDKPLFALFYLIAFGPQLTRRASAHHTLVAAGKALLCLLLCVIPLGMHLDYLQWDPKFPSMFWIWAANNLLVVCIAEEVFFRGFLQKNLAIQFNRFICGEWMAILVSAAAFGLAHFAGGWPYVGLATLAGVCYGFAFQQTRSLEAPLLCHFGLNLVHFLYFTYPASL
ncbi:MAG: CPBP family intramembrane metalloprotease [Zetaproteobacteria bacterium]|nr:CPBP family intramembrane metalloprotease [Zetaproteobacteria bacterium]